ncbi:MAG TPA: MaoC/PaaZ C-terminal domain-containing protein [Actinomycetota bacterium]|nr:MaoC/PaaZ C-terminal domain-containing protein [Actinomycetota bacterium]
MSLRFEDLAEGQEVPPLARTLGREDLVRYAEASGDRNPLHLDDEAARRAGFPGVIAHGMLTMGHLATCLTRWAGGAERLERLAAPFRAPVLPGDTIVAGGRVRSLDPAGRRAVLEVWVTVQRAGGAEHAIRRGEAVLRL